MLSLCAEECTDNNRQVERGTGQEGMNARVNEEKGAVVWTVVSVKGSE